MPFYIKKSLSFGPLRFNFSKSGVGVSAGVKGLRVGTGPNGNYIHAGRGGLYYRKSFSSRPQQSQQLQQSQVRDDGLREIESADAAGMTDSNSEELLAELNRKRTVFRWGPVAIIAGLFFALAFAVPVMIPVAVATITTPTTAAAMRLMPLTIPFVLSLLCFAAAIPLWTLDTRRRTTVIFYDLESPVLEAVERFHNALDTLASAGRIWLVEAEKSTDDWKRNAGATGLIKRTRVMPGERVPPYVQTNVRVFTLPAGRQTLYFFPDRLLVVDSNGFGSVSYADLDCSTEVTNFAETESAPPDGIVVKQTWRYPNRDGGPDRRFSNNYAIPIMRYEGVALRSSTGLNEQFMISRSSAVVQLPDAIAVVAEALSEARKQKPPVLVEQPSFAVIPPLQFMITQAMATKLRDMGYTQAQIDAMRPEMAYQILANAIPIDCPGCGGRFDTPYPDTGTATITCQCGQRIELS